MTRFLQMMPAIWTALFFIVSSAESLAQSDSLDRIVVTVNGEAIAESEVNRRIKYQIFNSEQAGRGRPSALAARQNAENESVTFRLQLQQARLQQLVVTDQDVERRIEQISKQGGLTREEFLRQFEPYELDSEAVKQSIFETLLLEVLAQRIIAPGITVTESEIDRYLKANQDQFTIVEQYNLNLIVIQGAPDATEDQKIFIRDLTNEIVRAFESGRSFDEVAVAARELNGVDAGELGWRRASDIAPDLVAAADGRAPGTMVGPLISGGNIFFVYVKGYRNTPLVDLRPVQQINLARIVLHAGTETGTEVNYEKLEKLRSRILDGENFADLARQYSHDDDTRKNGGDLGWLSENNIPFEYLNLLKTMQKGELSEVQKIRNTVYIIEFRGVRSANLEDQIRSYVQNLLRNHKMRINRNTWIDQLRASANIKFRSQF